MTDGATQTTDTTVACVDPDESSRESTLSQLRSEAEAATLLSAASVEETERLVRNRAVDCVVTEFDLPDGTGLDLAACVREIRPDVGCVLYTAADRSGFDTDDGSAVTEYVAKDAPNAAQQLGRVVEFTGTFRAQTSYPLPQNENDRLDALDAFARDDGALAADVERITDLVAEHLDVPMASVNLVKEHSQEFLACHGVDWTPTTREDSICTYTIVAEEPTMVVENVREDPRFEDNECLRDLGIRSYAGADLTTPDGLTIGTLCAYGREPRSFSDDDRAFLATLADVTMRLLTLRREVVESRGDRPETDGDPPETDGGRS